MIENERENKRENKKYNRNKWIFLLSKIKRTIHENIFKFYFSKEKYIKKQFKKN